MTLEGIEQGYKPEQIIYRGLDVMKRGQHLALVGPNRAGKIRSLNSSQVQSIIGRDRELGHL